MLAAKIRKKRNQVSAQKDIVEKVVNKDYDGAVIKLKQYVGQRSYFPGFKNESEKYVDHATDILTAMQTNHKFVSENTLAKHKEKEMKEKYVHHINELQKTLHKVETVYNNARFTDSRTTRYFLYVACWCLFAIFIAAFIIDIYRSLGSSTVSVVMSYVDPLINKIIH